MTPARPIAEDDLHAYVDGRLDPGRMGEIEAYLDAHPEVAARVAGHSRLRDGLRAALAPIAAEPIPPELNLASLVASRRQPPRFAGWGTIAACLLCLAVGGGGGYAVRSAGDAPRDGLMVLAGVASESYRTFAPDQVHPVEFRASDEAELKTWLSDRLHHPVCIPDLTKSGYRFMGGRLVATAQGPAGLFLYDGSGGRLGLLAQPMEHEGPRAGMAEMRGKTTVGLAWVDGSLGYSLVAPEATAGLHPLAEEVRRQTSSAI